MIDSRPPSSISTLPVLYAPARLVRNRIAPAISSSVPDLSSGILSFGNTPSPMIPEASSLGNTVPLFSHDVDYQCFEECSAPD
jgi:hypothetical protein